jgi:hypothetical protein
MIGLVNPEGVVGLRRRGNCFFDLFGFGIILTSEMNQYICYDIHESLDLTQWVIARTPCLGDEYFDCVSGVMWTYDWIIESRRCGWVRKYGNNPHPLFW